MLKLNKSDSILITGGTGLVGTALTKLLAAEGFLNIHSVGSQKCDLRDQRQVENLFFELKPKYVFHLAAKVYGIGGNEKFKSDALYENVLINTHVVEESRKLGVNKVVAMGSGCVYPELHAPQGLTENQIWLGHPHASEDSYAHAKRLMLAHLEAAQKQYGLKFAFAISGNLYGPYDNFNRETGHVTPSLIAKFFDAKANNQSVIVWGSGVAVRDFSYSEDAAFALYCMLKNGEGPINLGSGFLHSIKEIVEHLQKITGVEVIWDKSKSDGQAVRYYRLDKLASIGFKARVTLAMGIRKTYEWYAANWLNARG